MDHDFPELPASAPVIDCAAYDDGRRVANLGLDQIRDVLADTRQFVWLGLFEPDRATLRQVQEQFGLHDLAIEDAYKAHQRPKVELYDGSLFVVLRTAQVVRAPRHIEFGETHLFVGANFVITVRHGSLKSHVGLRQRCEAMPQQMAQGPGYVMYSLLDFVVDQYLPIVAEIEEDVQELEDTLLDDPSSLEATHRIYRLKRDLLALRRAVAPLADVANRMVRSDLPHVPEGTKPYFRDVYDHVLRLNEAIDMQRELLSMALEAHLSLLSVAQNDHMKRITAWAAMIAVPTMIAGIYGMNFRNMPELQWTYGYYGSLAVMAGSCVGLFVGFRRSGWL